ncbi:MAG: hypothetical protein AAF487_06050 [Bacteroidota bacterium]
MSKFFRNGLIFLTLVVVLYPFCFFLLGNISLAGQPLINWFNPNLSTKGTIHRASIEFNEDQPFQLAVFGSSHAYRGYDPRIFEEKMDVKMFNFGSSAQSIPNSYHYIKQECAKNTYDIVILDLLVSIFENRDLESSIILTRNVADDQLARNILWEEKDIRLANIYLARHLILEDDYFYENPDYIKYGFVSKTDSMKAPNIQRPYKEFDPSERVVQRFKDLLHYCHQNDVPLVLVNQPRPVQTNEEKNKEFSEFIIECNAPYNFPVFDYSLDHELKTDYNFYDLGHMNQTGVEYFNSRLIRDLKTQVPLKQDD